MTDNKAKLERLRRQIEQAAEKDAEKLVADAEKQAEQMISEETAKLEKNISGAILGKTARFEAEERKRLAESRYAADRKVLLHRNTLVDGLFGEIRTELESFTASDGYVKYLADCAKRADEEEKLSGSVIAYVKSRDTEAAAKALSAYSVKIETDRSIEIGGIIFKYTEKGKYIDLTIDTAFENERSEFSAKSEMQL